MAPASVADDSSVLDRVYARSVSVVRDLVATALDERVAARNELSVAERYRKFTVGEGETMTIRYDPVAPTASTPEWTRDWAGRFDVPPTEMYELPDAKLVGDPPLLLLNGSILATHCLGPQTEHMFVPVRNLLDRLGVVRTLSTLYAGRARPDPNPERYGTIFPLVDRRGNSFAHWFDEILPKLRYYERYRDRTGTNPELIVPADMTDWQAESLRLAGYDGTDYTRWSGGPAIAETVVAPSHRIRSGAAGVFEPAPSDRRWTRERILSNLPAADRTDAAPYLFVSRADSNHRRLANEDAVLRRLKPLGFRRCVLSEVSLSEQVRLFADADVIVGPHGAGLTHLLWAEDARVVELVGEGAPVPHFFVLANELNLGYDAVTCERVADPNVEPRHQDLLADPDAVEAAAAAAMR